MARTILGEQAYKVLRWYREADSKSTRYELESDTPPEVIAMLEILTEKEQSLWTPETLKTVFDALDTIIKSPNPETLDGVTIIRIRTELQGR